MSSGENINDFSDPYTESQKYRGTDPDEVGSTEFVHHPDALTVIMEWMSFDNDGTLHPPRPRHDLRRPAVAFPGDPVQRRAEALLRELSDAGFVVIRPATEADDLRYIDAVADLVQYRQATAARLRAVARELTHEAERLGLGYSQEGPPEG